MKKCIVFIAAGIFLGFVHINSSDTISTITTISDSDISGQDESFFSGISVEDQYPDDFEIDDEEAQLPSSSMFVPFVEQKDEPRLYIENHTGKYIATIPDSYDAQDIQKIQQRGFLVSPQDDVIIPISMIQSAYDARIPRRGREEGTFENLGGAIVMVMYKDISKGQDELLAFLDTNSAKTVFTIKTLQRFYYEGIDSKEEIVANGLPFPYANQHHASKHISWYPHKELSYPATELDPSKDYELYIYRKRTPIQKNGRQFIHVMECLDIRQARR